MLYIKGMLVGHGAEGATGSVGVPSESLTEALITEESNEGGVSDKEDEQVYRGEVGVVEVREVRSMISSFARIRVESIHGNLGDLKKS